MPWMLIQDNCCRPFGTKLEDFLASFSSPDILLLGSSLTLVSSARCDDAWRGVPARTDPWWYVDIVTNYGKADYLQDLFRRQTNLPITVSNLSLSGAMVSDDLYVLHQIKRKDWKPKLVICCLAPRDFVSNDTGSGPDTYVFYGLKKLRHAYPELTLVKARPISQLALNLANLHEHIDTRRNNVRAVALALYNHFESGKQFQPLIGIRDGQFSAGYDPRPNTLVDLKVYKDRYNPPNFEQCKQHFKYLEALFKYCAKEKIALAIVSMPLPAQNLAVLDSNLLKMYRNGLREKCTKAAIPLLDLQAEHYSLDNFEDSCHMNARGGKQIFERIAREFGSLVTEQTKLCNGKKTQLSSL
jgi:hypothetical protein